MPKEHKSEESKSNTDKRTVLKSQKNEFQQFLTEKSKIINPYIKGKRREEDLNYVTIWDLPTDIKHKEIYNMCRKFKEVQIVKIKKTRFKTLAVIETTSK